MNQDERMESIVSAISTHSPLTPVELDPEITKADSFLKILKVKCFNWQSDKLDKVHALRFDVSYPKIETLNMIIYPKQCFDAPIFLIFFFVSNKKVICHINVNTPFRDEAYLAKWQQPIQSILDKYEPFEVMDRYPEWMQQLRHPTTIYGLFQKERLDELTSCLFEQLNFYLPLVAECEEVTDPDRLKTIADFHASFREDIRTRDKAQGMMSKFIGKEKARRIFYEVTT